MSPSSHFFIKLNCLFSNDMYKIEKTHYGFRINFLGYFDTIDLQKFKVDSEKLLSEFTSPFSVLVDLRKFDGRLDDFKFVLDYIRFIYMKNDMIRSGVVVSGMNIVIELKRIAELRGIYRYERYIDSEFHTNWEFRMLDWVENGKDPDLRIF